MPGSIYLKNLRLCRAYSEGFEGDPAVNPHPTGSPEAEAYNAGALLQDCSTYAGPAGCTGVAAGRATPAPGAMDAEASSKKKRSRKKSGTD